MPVEPFHRGLFSDKYLHRNLERKAAFVERTPVTGPGGVLAEKLGRGVRPASQNPYPIYDQNLRFSLPYL